MWFVGNTDTGFVVKSPRGLTIAGVQYPRNIFNLWSKAELAAIGIMPYREVNLDARYYVNGVLVREVVNGEVIATPEAIEKDVADLKEQMLDQVNRLVSSKQGEIDWYWSRAAKGGKAVPQDIQDYATAVYVTQAIKEDEIEALATLDDIKAYRAKPAVETRYVKHTAEDGVETYGPETETHDRELDEVMSGWPEAPNAEADPSFVSLVYA